MSEARTSTIKRPDKRSTVKKPARPKRAADAGRSRLGDLTSPIAVDRRLTRRRRSTLLLALVALVIAGAIAAALFVLPIQTYLGQNDDLAQRVRQLEQLETINADLQNEVDRLRTDDGVREAAREEIGYVETGEGRLTMMSFPDLPTDLPPGWPYGVVSGILALRSATESP